MKIIYLLHLLLAFSLNTVADTISATVQDTPLSIPQNSKNYKKWLKEFKTTPTNLKYKIIKQGRGLKPQTGDLLFVHYKGYLPDNKIFENSNISNRPLEFNHGVGQVIRGWDEAFSMFNEGTKAIVVIPSELGYGKQGAGKIPPNSTLIFELELLKVIPQTPIEPFKTEGIKPVITKSGIKIYTIEQGEGDFPDSTSIVTFNFTGFLPDGKIFDSSILSGSPEKIRIGDQSIIKGVSIALTHLNTGTKARVIIPSKLAFGKKGYSTLIPPKTDLIYDIELLNIKQTPKIFPYHSDADTIELQNGLKYIPIYVTDNVMPENDDLVAIHYSAYFENGEMFDSSILSDKEIVFPVGEKGILQGLSTIVTYMHQGDKFRVFIPYQLAYGEKGLPPVIPPKTNVIYDIELLYVIK